MRASSPMRGRNPFIDFSQARWIAQASLTMELRRRGGATGTSRRFTGLFLMVLSYLMAGFFVGVVYQPGIDPFTGGLLVCSVLMVLLAVFVAAEFSTILLSPEDDTFYLPLPVSVRTYIATKLAVLCILCVVFAIAFALPLLNIAALRGVPLATVGGLLYSIIFSSLIITLLVVALLGIAVRAVPARWITRAATYAQLLLMLVLYGGFSLSQTFLRTGLLAAHVPLTAVLLLAPSSWAPSIFRIGSAGMPAILGLSLSMLTPFLLFVASFRLIAPFYGERILESVASNKRTRKMEAVRLRSVLWRSPEERAIALLIRNHFRYNAQFRMSILMVVPLTLFMLVSTVFINHVRVLDPFIDQGKAAFPSTLLLYMAIAMFPFSVKVALTHSMEAEASWLIAASPADRILLLRAMRRFALVFFIIPYLLFLGVVFLVLTHSVVHTVQHFAVVGILVVMETDLIIYFRPEMPFSIQTIPGTLSGQVFLQLLPAAIVIVVLLLIVLVVYPYPLVYWLVLGALIGSMMLVRTLGRRAAATRLAEADRSTS
jgi:hypothetical protein